MAVLLAVAAASAEAGRYLHWGVISISLTNFLIIVGMVVVFLLALVLPFPGGRQSDVAQVPEQRHEEERP
jgi:hypothetical protein